VLVGGIKRSSPPSREAYCRPRYASTSHSQGKSGRAADKEALEELQPRKVWKSFRRRRSGRTLAKEDLEELQTNKVLMSFSRGKS